MSNPPETVSILREKMGSFPILSRDIKHTFYHPVSQHISALSSSQLKKPSKKTNKQDTQRIVDENRWKKVNAGVRVLVYLAANAAFTWLYISRLA